MKIVIDDGSNYIKLASKDNNSVFPSRIINKAFASLSGDGYSKSSFKIGNNSYSFDEFGQDTLPTNSRDYQTSEHNRVLIHHALRSIGCENKASIAVTIPVSAYFNSDGSVNQEYIKRKADNSKGEIKYLDGSDSIVIDECYVLAESIPAFVYARHELGLTGDRYLIIDIGGTTTDVAIITSNQQIEKSFSLNVGSLKFITDFSIKASERLELSSDLTDNLALKGLMTGELLKQDISDIADAIKNDFSSKIHNSIKQRVGDTRVFDNVILSGGGSTLLNLNYDNAVRTKNPQLDNANGCLLMLGWNDEN